MYWRLNLKSPRFVPFGANLTYFWPRYYIPDLVKIWLRCYKGQSTGAPDRKWEALVLEKGCNTRCKMLSQLWNSPASVSPGHVYTCVAHRALFCSQTWLISFFLFSLFLFTVFFSDFFLFFFYFYSDKSRSVIFLNVTLVSLKLFSLELYASFQSHSS